MIKSLTPLDRRYLPIQAKEEYDDRCQAVVPIHPDILGLPDSVLTDGKLARDTLSSIGEQFEREVEDYITTLREKGYQSIIVDDRVEDYGHFDCRWLFDFSAYNGLMKMSWELDEKEPYEMVLLTSPVLVSNAVESEIMRDLGFPNKKGEPEEYEIAPNVTIIYGSKHVPDFVFMPTETMLEYEMRPQMLLRKIDGWKAEICVRAFCSSYVNNVPQALLLRNWAVEYHNRLLEQTRL